MKTSGEQAYCKCETTEVCSCMSSGCTTAWEAWDTETDGLLFACTLFPNTTKVTSKVQSYVSTSWRTMKGDRLCQDAKQYEMFVRRMCFTKCCVKDVEFAVLRFALIILSFFFICPRFVIRLNRVFWGVLGTRFGSLESEKIIVRPLASEKIGSLQSEKSGPYH